MTHRGRAGRTWPFPRFSLLPRPPPASADVPVRPPCFLFVPTHDKNAVQPVRRRLAGERTRLAGPRWKPHNAAVLPSRPRRPRMAATPVPPAPEADDPFERRTLLRRFTAAWRHGRPALDDYLPAGGPEYLPLLRALVRADLAHRRRAGEPARVEEYLRRYP